MACFLCNYEMLILSNYAIKQEVQFSLEKQYVTTLGAKK